MAQKDDRTAQKLVAVLEQVPKQVLVLGFQVHHEEQLLLEVELFLKCEM